jgi:4-amino-4-deoxy-L-arabinose transferase-like glycosyltransferase
MSAAQRSAAQQYAAQQYAGLGTLATMARSDAPPQLRILPEYLPEQPVQVSPQGMQRPRRDLWRAWWLPVILLAQALLSLRLIWANTAFQDEALYLWAGHRMWSHWLYGAPVPGFPSYFSGAPVVYPPLGALADTYGGLAGARLLSLAFMLLATSLLYLATRRIFGPRSALLAACLFAGLGATQFLGALATYDAMAIALLALATCLGLRAAATTPTRRTVLMVLAGLVLASADATKYAAALFDPVVIAAVMAYGWRQRGRRSALAAAAVLLLTTVAVLAAAVLIGGHSYWHAVMSTTLARPTGDVAPAGVIYVSAIWAGGVMVLALIGAAAVFVIAERWAMRCLAFVLAGAAFLAPAEQARIHTITSLFKHVGFGAWFGCIVAGFGLASLQDVVPTTKVAAAARVGLAATALSALAGMALANLRDSP